MSAHLSPVPAPALTAARRAHLLAKAKQLHQQREAAQQQQIARLTSLTSSLTTHSSPHSSTALSHTMDPLIAADDGLHTRYTAESIALTRALASQQDSMAEMSLLLARLQSAIAPTSSPVPRASLESENALLRDWVRVLRARVEERDAEVDVLKAMMARKSARIAEVKEEGAVMVDEMRELLQRMTREKEKREGEMREEREALLSNLRDLIDVCVRENEFMKTNSTEQQRAELDAWKEREEGLREQRDSERRAIRQKERDRQQQQDSLRPAQPQPQREAERRAEQGHQLEREREAQPIGKEEAAVAAYSDQEERKLPQAPPPQPSVVLLAQPTRSSAVGAGTKRSVHFRQPSASPTFHYSPALPSSISSSPLTSVVPAMQLQALEAVPSMGSQLAHASVLAAQPPVHNPPQSGYQKAPLQPQQPYRHASTLPVPPTSSRFPPEPTPTFVSGHSAHSPSSSPSIGSYFASAPDADFLSELFPPPTATVPSPTDVDPAPLHPPQQNGFTQHASVKAELPAAGKPITPPSSMSDRVMGRVGGWLVGGRVPPARAQNGLQH